MNCVYLSKAAISFSVKIKLALTTNQTRHYSLWGKKYERNATLDHISVWSKKNTDSAIFVLCTPAGFLTNDWFVENKVGETETLYSWLNLLLNLERWKIIIGRQLINLSKDCRLSYDNWDGLLIVTNDFLATSVVYKHLICSV